MVIYYCLLQYLVIIYCYENCKINAKETFLTIKTVKFPCECEPQRTSRIKQMQRVKYKM